jgi:two-component system OmpR family response regulator
MRVLLVEDDTAIRTALQQALGEDGYAVDATGDGEEGRWYATSNAYDLIVLDLMLPGIDGMELLRLVRAGERHPAVLIVSARDAVEDRVRGLDLGADDYLVKPFALSELLARARSLVRRHHQQPRPTLSLACLTLDTSTRTAACAGVPLLLTPREYALLEYLMRRAGSLVSRSELWEHIYAFHDEASSNVVDHFIARLRRKLGDAGAPPLIHTRRGQGYLMAVEPMAP